MTLILEVVAFILALVDELQANGKSLLGWAVIFLCIALLAGKL